MAPFETYQSNAAELPIMRKWVIRCLILSLLLHAGLYVFFRNQQIESFSAPPLETAPPARFVVNKVTIDAKLLEPPPEVRVKLPPKTPLSTPIVLPSEKPQPRDVQLKPQNKDMAAILPQERPDLAPMNLDALAKNQAESAGRADKELGSIAATLLKSSEKAPRQPSITLPEGGTAAGEGLGGPEGIPGRQSIDDALAKVGTGQGSSQPVGMPGGALFEHGSADLRPESLELLGKIGELIAGYPAATFLISGHTDWTGTAEINQRLSERRAEAVKGWLVANMHVAPERIRIIGRGTADAIVAADKSVEEQRPNRRVEIVIQTRRKP